MNTVTASDLVLGDSFGFPERHEKVREAQQLSKEQIEAILLETGRLVPTKRVPSKHKSVRVKARKQARLTRRANR